VTRKDRLFAGSSILGGSAIPRAPAARRVNGVVNAPNVTIKIHHNLIEGGPLRVAGAVSKVIMDSNLFADTNGQMAEFDEVEEFEAKDNLTK